MANKKGIKKPKSDKKEVKKNNVETSIAPKNKSVSKRKMFEIKLFSSLSALEKLRYIISTIFILSTLAIIIVFANNFFISVILVLISYLMVFVLMVKLFMIKRL